MFAERKGGLTLVISGRTDVVANAGIAGSMQSENILRGENIIKTCLVI